MFRTKPALALPLLALFAACGDDETNAEDAPLEVTLPFAATVGDAPAACGTTFDALGAGAVSAELADARLFLSEIALRNGDGEWVALALDDTRWQHDGVALLDFEDGTGACADSGTADLNELVTGTLPAGTYDAVRFDVGVPFALNHIDATTAAAPFNVPGMYWAWQSGFKFVRVDWKVGDARWNIHVGSTGCVSDAPTAAPSDVCDRSNRATVLVEGFDLETDAVEVDLGALVANASIEQNAADTPPGCMSSPGEPADCSPVFDALGMAFDSGACANDCAGQTTFTKAQ